MDDGALRLQDNAGGLLLNFLIAFFKTTQETVAESVRNGYITEKTSLTAAASLVPNFDTSVSTRSKTLSHPSQMCKLFSRSALHKLILEAESGHLFHDSCSRCGTIISVCLPCPASSPHPPTPAPLQFQQLLSMLSEAQPQLADVLRKQFPV